MWSAAKRVRRHLVGRWGNSGAVWLHANTTSPPARIAGRDKRARGVTRLTCQDRAHMRRKRRNHDTAEPLRQTLAQIFHRSARHKIACPRATLISAYFEIKNLLKMIVRHIKRVLQLRNTNFRRGGIGEQIHHEGCALLGCINVESDS